MEEETKRLLKENLELSRENNKILRKIRRSAIVGNIMRLFYWAFIIGVPVFLYFQFLEPYLAQLLDVYSGLQSGAENVQEVGEQLPIFSKLLQMVGIGK